MKAELQCGTQRVGFLGLWLRQFCSNRDRKHSSESSKVFRARVVMLLWFEHKLRKALHSKRRRFTKLVQ